MKRPIPAPSPYAEEQEGLGKHATIAIVGMGLIVWAIGVSSLLYFCCGSAKTSPQYQAQGVNQK